LKDALDLFVGNYVVAPTEGVTHEPPVIKEKMDTRLVIIKLLHVPYTLTAFETLDAMR
jgi:hypothetical protein